MCVKNYANCCSKMPSNYTKTLTNEQKLYKFVNIDILAIRNLK
ncbi:hypothetical protein HMPREF9193_01598 [Treponema lecithinolyticum ATCC 700332]|uniref:Uncharacterized protein n=1 Tax=Treponema lecithinolyticum ATCC 700332 TaxID=1321815 RepID=A0ABN0NX52_TRELE|nr:hypothetical protein HMPREF9193_01598 [Treponema lecithinolyticum ATCC 700332]